MICQMALKLFLVFLLCSRVESAVNGGWAPWSSWSGWAKGQCSGNQRVRTRTCTNPMPSTDGNYCTGDSAINEQGPVDGGWNDWSQWSTCMKPCGGSIVNRTRACNSPSPANGGSQCSGDVLQTKLECLSKCPEGRVDGGYGEWSSWSPCRKTCSNNGGSYISRSRRCDAPPPMNGGSACQGPNVERILSCFNNCPRNGGFGLWSSWTRCSKDCGTGTQKRRRFCNSPEPAGKKAANCTGTFESTRPCKIVDCLHAVNGSWSSWSSWSACTSQYCMKGEKSRTRSCNNPPPRNGGDICPGSAKETIVCPSSHCRTYVPTLAPASPVFPSSYMGRECGVNMKYRSATPTGMTVPSAVYRRLSFKDANFRNGYFNFKSEDGGKIIKYCFDPEPAISIKDVADNLIQSYRRTIPILGYERPADESQPITGFFIKVKNATGYDVVEYDFGLEFRDFFSPGQNIELRNVSITYNTKGAQASIMAKGEYYRFTPTIFNSRIFRYQKHSALTGETRSMKIQHVFSFLGLSHVPGYMESAMRAIKVWDFEFGPCTIAYDFFEGWKETVAPFRFSATKYIDGIPVHLEIIAKLKGTRWLFGIGFVFDGESFGAVIGKINGKKLPDGGFFDSVGVNVEAGILFNPMDPFQVSTGSTAFTKEPLKSAAPLTVPKGLLLTAQVSLPKDCGGSSFCRVTKKLVGPDVKFRVSALFKGLQDISITAGFYMIKLTDKIWFSRLELFIILSKANQTTTFGFRAEVKFPVNSGAVYADGFKLDNYLSVGGQIYHTLGTADIKGALYMRGIWRNAFGSDWFAIGDIFLGLTVTIGSPIGVSGGQLGGRLEFGKNCLYSADFENDGHCVMVRIYFGIGKPNTFFYGELSALTIGKLVRMVGGDAAAIPRPVAETGFPKGVMVSYNAGKAPVDLAIAGGPYIYIGFRLKGTLNLFGYEIRAEVRIGDLETYIDGECDPIHLGGVVVIARNKTHQHLGPKLLYHHRPKEASFIKLPYFKMFFEGYGRFFGIEAYAYINITMQATEIYIWGKAWNLIYAELYISAGYDVLDYRNAHFYVRIIVDLRGLTDAIEKARKSVDAAFKAAQRTLNEKIEDVKRAKRRCKEKMQLKCQKCHSLKCKEAENNCKGFLDKAGKWIGGVINAAGRWIKKTARKIRDGLAKVGRAIKKFFSGWRRRRSLLHKRNENFDLHVRNRRFISKLICEGLVGGGCRGVSHLCYGSCKAVNFIGQGLCSILDIAVGALKAAEAVVGWVNAAIQFVLQMFLIHGIRFELGLGHKFGGGFMVAAEIDLTLFGNRMQFGFSFDLNNGYKSITSAKDSGMYKYKQGVKQPRTAASFNVYDPPNPFTDFDLSGTFGIEASFTGDGIRLGSCLAAVDKNEHSKLVLTGCNSTDTKQQWSYTLKGSLINLYSNLCLDMSKTVNDYVVQKKCKDDTDNQKYECDVVTRSFKRRRSSNCATAVGRSSPKGPGSLSHLGSLKCINVDHRNRLVLRTECQTSSSEWELEQNNILRNKRTGYCVRPVHGNAVAGAELEIASTGCHQFVFTEKGSLQHKNQRLCVQTARKEMKPNDFTKLILGTQCDHVRSSASPPALPDPQMVFSFIPTNKYVKMEPCSFFDDMRIEQRFEVRDEELASICSKYAHDIALKKVAVQSSTAHNGFAHRAVDGNYKFHWSDKTCTHTNNERDPWWRVDLGMEYIVTDVTIINRGENGDRLKNVQVHVGNNEHNNAVNPVCHDRIRQASDGEAVRVQCNPPIPGRYVSVQMYGNGILTLCEVIVNSRIGGLADYCQIENGGCDQLCFNKCDKKTSCGCLSGYHLAYDKTTCLDVNECRSNNGGCRTDKHAKCINIPGTYKCVCDPGYILKDNSLTECVDFDECGHGNGGCEQMCSNTNGGYLCECRAGFKRKPNNPYGCEDINECITNNGGCDQICDNYQGGHNCRCNTGFKLAINGKTCEEVYCRPLESPVRGSISPNICTEKYHNIRIGTVCKFNCNTGYEIANNNAQDSISCRIDGTWDHWTPSCHPVKCPALHRPHNGGIIPNNCASGNREYGQRCVVYCKHGYKLNGPATKYCQPNKQWSNNAATHCVKIVQKPYLNCPSDVQVTLKPHQSSAALGINFPEPQTNLAITRVSHRRDHLFKVGLTPVKFEAVSEEGVKKTCDVLVEVKDVTPPKVSNCPGDIVKKISTVFTIIVWPTPVFTDAVGVSRVEAPHKKSGAIWTVGQSAMLQYRAMDASQNSAKCTFKVTVKSQTCPILTGNKYANIYTITNKRTYSVSCTGGRSLFGAYSSFGEMAYCQDGDYYIMGKKIGLTLPDCVKFSASGQTSNCSRGMQKFTYEDWYGFKQYSCRNCPTGTFRDETSLSCAECPIGTYQDDEGMSECQPCPDTHSTKETGAKNINQCISKCMAGSFSPTGLDDSVGRCTPCPKDTYSEVNGSRECVSCPPGSTTLGTVGAAAESRCFSAPNISDVLPDTRVSETAGGMVNLICLFKNPILPPPTKSWTKLGGTIQANAIENDIVNLDLKVVGMMLMLDNVKTADSGVYRCSAQNAVGSDSKTINLTVS